ncbi:class A beta-lactamase [Pseudoxanthomonas sacheonensis]|uniref:Beta-lactamase n=1 Tax=Pseudoxanthomonas sacheonensis TaxID=443615 RepID=A0ABU1RUQ5_9GAMM|nr:class A beta-lactamase [Pseudoxanthomonas sacheonensis]MDR6842506.1 beta-lactamase class A [Pseudoxanthomonas sacheonensis]
MTLDPSRRSLLLAIACSATLAPFGGAFAAGKRDAEAQDQLEALERRHGGRLGVSLLDTGTGKRVGHRADERFPMCSTFKFLAAAQVLARVDRGEERLDRRIVYSKDDLVAYSPVTEKHVGEPGMSLAELCHATITLSDNTAGNLLLASFGGPAGLTAFARSLGDDVTRLDRWETELNEAIPGDPRDTTSPAAMLDDMRLLLLGDTLLPASRKQLADWLVATTTGGQRIRGGLPKGWRAGDKTGTSGKGETNDIAIVWPPGRAPLLVTAYHAESTASQETNNSVIAEVGRIAASL